MPYPLSMPWEVALAADGTIVPGAKLYCYRAGTLVLQTVFQDAALLVPHPNPVRADGYGAFAPIFLDYTAANYKFILTDALDVSVAGRTVDNYPAADFSAAQIGVALYPRTAAETTLAIVPGDYSYPAGHPWRYGADGAGAINDTTALASAKSVAAQSGLNGWRNGASSGALLRTTAEVSAAILASDFSRTTEPYDPRRYGAKFDNLTDDTAAISSALSVGTQNVAGAQGACVLAPSGNTLLSSMVTLPNRVRLKGQNKRGSYFQAKAGHPGPWLFNAKNGTSSMFDSTLENLSVDAANIAGLGCVLSDAWQEGCGLRDVMLINFATAGVKFQNGYNGASLAKIIDTEIFGGTTAGAIGIDLQQISTVGAFMLAVSDTSITGGAPSGALWSAATAYVVGDIAVQTGAVYRCILNHTNQVPPNATYWTLQASLARGINVVNDSLHCRNVHFETCITGIYLDGVGNHVFVGVTGSTTVTTLVEVAATFTGTLTMLGCFRNGAVNFIKDNRTIGIGTIAGLDYASYHLGPLPVVAPGANWSAGYFDGTVTGTNPATAGFNVASVQRVSAGVYTITETRSRPSVACAPWASCNLASVSVNVALLGVSTYQITLKVAGTNTDSSEVKFGNVRLQ